MRILIAGGSDAIEQAVIPPLLLRQHQIRLLTSPASGAAERRRELIEVIETDLTRPTTILGMGNQCDLAILAVDTLRGAAPGDDLRQIEILATENFVAECERAGIRRIIHLSTLGTTHPANPWQRAKRDAEDRVRNFPHGWTILRGGLLLSPEDPLLGLLIELVRLSPFAPAVSDAGILQPVWHEDLGNAVARTIDRPEITHQTLEVAGNDRVTLNQLLQRIATLLEQPLREVPVPAFIERLAERVAAELGLERTVADGWIRRLLDESSIPEGASNALPGTFGIEPLPLDESLRLLIERRG